MAYYKKITESGIVEWLLQCEESVDDELFVEITYEEYVELHGSLQAIPPDDELEG